MTLTYLSDLYDLFILNRFYEGYYFVIKVFMFDILMIIPLLLIIATKNNFELKVWSALSFFLQNLVLILGFKPGAIYATIIGLILILGFILTFKRFNLNEI
jgi:hypothetical protein